MLVILVILCASLFLVIVISLIVVCHLQDIIELLNRKSALLQARVDKCESYIDFLEKELKMKDEA